MMNFTFGFESQRDRSPLTLENVSEQSETVALLIVVLGSILENLKLYFSGTDLLQATDFK